MDFSVAKDIYINGYAKEAWLNKIKVWSKGIDVDAIMNSLICWYDIKRQGCTNESMSANPVLRDLSGNGHDATCYNFAWNRQSGISSYFDFNLLKHENWEDYVKDVTETSFIYHHPGNDTSVMVDANNYAVYPFQIKVTGITDTGLRLEYGRGTIPETESSIKTDGVYTITRTGYSGFKLYGDESITCNIKIEQIAYPNALVSDGVDDYAKVTGLPLLTKERGYTVIAKRKTISNIYDTGLASKRGSDASGAFVVEKNANRYYSFGYTGIITFSTKDIIYQTSKQYCGISINSGGDKDSDYLILFAGYNLNGQIHEHVGAAIYSFLLFDRDLTEQEIEWVKKNLIEGNDDDVDWYGVEFYTTSPYPDCIRIGNPELHKTLPVHSQMKGCLLADDGTVNKYLNETDWTGETLDGSQGQVMVEMPKESYWKFETDGNIRRVKFSTKPLPGFKKTPQGYVSAYEAALQRSTKKLASVVNTDADYRGGNNHAGWDGTYRSLLGMPATQISRTDFRNYARNRKADSTEWNCMTYDMQKLLYWLFVIEYATLNTQKTFNSAKTSGGYAQGGLGDGFTTLDWYKWTNFNNNNPVVPCGYTDELGNGTGQKEYSMPSEYDATIKKLYVPRYRGIENPFGHIWQWTDGINVQIEPGAELSKVFVCDDPSKFNDSNYDGYQYVGNEARTESYVKSVIFGEKGEIIPDVVGGGSSTYFCDHHYTSVPNTETLHGVLFGGCANDGSGAGFVCAYSRRAPSYSAAHVGSRLCFIPNNN